MGAIRFEEIRNYYHPHNEMVFEKLVKAQRSGTLVPFVGAGLSVFCGYPLWASALKALAKYIIDEAVRESVIGQIEDNQFEAAAQKIEEHYPPILDALTPMFSPEKLQQCPDDALRSSANYALPFLFPKSLVVTTNFDRVLETVFQKTDKPFGETVTPNRQELLAQLRQNSGHALVKLHGDIGSDTVDRNELVFTARQYDEKYAADSPVVRELTRCFENRRLLFLGCGLKVDRTLDTLKQVIQAQPGIEHYAVLDCERSEIPKRLQELYSMGILPLFYEKGKHDAVRVLLERLLEETDRKQYQSLMRDFPAMPTETKEERRLMFDAEYFPFTGREAELEALRAFCDCEAQSSWWAVTGPGGMGKSRLVYEFTKMKRKDGWTVQRFEATPSRDSSAGRLEDLADWCPPTAPTIVVLDDVQAHMSQVMQWLTGAVRCRRSEKLRILLIEREGERVDAAPWLGETERDDVPADWCYRKDFLYLTTLSDEELRKIMDEYADAAGKSLNAELLLKTLEKVDPGLKRPLYAIAIADARCQGKDPTNWDRKKVLDVLLQRELDFHFHRLSGLYGKTTRTLKTELKELLTRSCVQQFLPLDELDMEAYPKLKSVLDKLDMDEEEFLERLGVLRTVRGQMVQIDKYGKIVGEWTEESRKVVMLSCPDLIKEHFVLELALEQKKTELLFSPEWETNPGRLQFLSSLLADHSERLRDQSEFWDRIFGTSPGEGFPAYIYGRLLLGYAVNYPADKGRALERLSRLYDETDHDPEIADSYSMVLMNLSAAQDEAGRAETVESLNALYNTHSKRPIVAKAYAGGLVNLSAKQDEKGCVETAEKLKKLYETHSDHPGVAEAYAKGLGNLSHNQDEKGCLETAEKLKKLYGTHSDNSVIAEEYAEGLVNLFYEQDETDHVETVEKLKELYRTHFDHPGITEKYACVMGWVTAKQNVEKCTRTVEMLKELFQKHPQDARTAAGLFCGLLSLSLLQSPEARAKTAAEMERLLQMEPTQESVYEACAGILVTLALLQKSEAAVGGALAWSERILSGFPENEFMQLCYAATWFNLTLQQAEENAGATVLEIAEYLRGHVRVVQPFQDKLEEYLRKHPDHAARYLPLSELRAPGA